VKFKYKEKPKNQIQAIDVKSGMVLELRNPFCEKFVAIILETLTCEITGVVSFRAIVKERELIMPSSLRHDSYVTVIGTNACLKADEYGYFSLVDYDRQVDSRKTKIINCTVGSVILLHDEPHVVISDLIKVMNKYGTVRHITNPEMEVTLLADTCTIEF